MKIKQVKVAVMDVVTKVRRKKQPRRKERRSIKFLAYMRMILTDNIPLCRRHQTNLKRSIFRRMQKLPFLNLIWFPHLFRPVLHLLVCFARLDCKNMRNSKNKISKSSIICCMIRKLKRQKRLMITILKISLCKKHQQIKLLEFVSSPNIGS